MTVLARPLTALKQTWKKPRDLRRKLKLRKVHFRTLVGNALCGKPSVYDKLPILFAKEGEEFTCQFCLRMRQRQSVKLVKDS